MPRPSSPVSPMASVSFSKSIVILSLLIFLYSTLWFGPRCADSRSRFALCFEFVNRNDNLLCFVGCLVTNAQNFGGSPGRRSFCNTCYRSSFGVLVCALPAAAFVEDAL